MICILLQSDNVIYADFPDEGFDTFIKNNKLMPEEEDTLNEWMTKDYSQPCNTMFVIYSASVGSQRIIKIGNGTERVVIKIPIRSGYSNQAMQTQTQSRVVKLTVHQQENHTIHGSSGGDRGVLGAGAGAVLSGAAYIACAANPVTVPLLILSTGGAMIGAALTNKPKTEGTSTNRSRTITLECPVDELDRLSGMIDQLQGTKMKALE